MTAQAKQPTLNAPASEWLVYADALQEARDPRGELIVLNHAVESGKTPADDRDAYVAKHAEALIGKGAKADTYRIGWKHCLIDSADLLIGPTTKGDRLIEQLFASPAATNIRSVSLVGVPDGETRVDLATAMDKLATSLPKTCTSVGFIDDRAAKTNMLVSRDFEPDTNLVSFGSLNPFVDHEIVEHIKVSCADADQLGLSGFKAPSLKSFVFHCLRFGVEPYGDGDPPLVGVFNETSWPKLENLELRLSESFTANIVADEDAYVPSYATDENYEDRMDEAEDAGENEGTNWANLQPLLDNLKKSPLKRLALTSFDSESTLLELLETAGLPPTLEELDLSDSSLSSADWFIKNKDMIKPLKRLIIERVTMSDDDAKKLATLGPEIKHSTGSGNGGTYRYIVGSE